MVLEHPEFQPEVAWVVAVVSVEGVNRTQYVAEALAEAEEILLDREVE